MDIRDLIELEMKTLARGGLVPTEEKIRKPFEMIQQVKKIYSKLVRLEGIGVHPN